MPIVTVQILGSDKKNPMIHADIWLSTDIVLWINKYNINKDIFVCSYLIYMLQTSSILFCSILLPTMPNCHFYLQQKTSFDAPITQLQMYKAPISKMYKILWASYSNKKPFHIWSSLSLASTSLKANLLIVHLLRPLSICLCWHGTSRSFHCLHPSLYLRHN